MQAEVNYKEFIGNEKFPRKYADTSVIVIVNQIFQNAQILKLKGWADHNIDYDEAKKPKSPNKNWYIFKNEMQMKIWINKQKGWIGVAIPEDRIVIDVDNNVSGELVKKLLDEEGIRHHCIKTPNGYQYIFKAGEEDTKTVKQVTKFFTQIGVVIDTRTTGNGYVVFPTQHTENRFILSQSDELDELPHFLRPIRQVKPENDKNYYQFPLPVENGSRDDTLYHFAAHLNAWAVPKEEAVKSMKLIYKYFVLDKTDFSEEQLLKKIEQGYNWEPNHNQDFIINKNGKKIVCLHNTRIILERLEIELYYDDIKKRSIMKSSNNIYNGFLSDYHAIKILDFALTFGYMISKNKCIDHLLTLAKDNAVNKVSLFFEQVREKWDGVSRLEEVFNTLNSRTDRDLALAYFKTWCIQAVRLAENSNGKMNQEHVLVLQGGQGAGKTSWFKQLFSPIGLEYFKEGLDLNPDNKDSVLECVSHFAVELGELDATMKHEQAKLKAFITRSWDEVRKPFDRLSELTPRQTVLCATVNEPEFLKDKTGNRRYGVIKTGDTIERLNNIDLIQFWGEIATLSSNGESHMLTNEEKEKQRIENSDFETMNEAEIRVETNFIWGTPKHLWKERTSAHICEVIGMSKMSKNVGQALRKKGCEDFRKGNQRIWLVPPFINNYNEKSIYPQPLYDVDADPNYDVEKKNS